MDEYAKSAVHEELRFFVNRRFRLGGRNDKMMFYPMSLMTIMPLRSIFG